MISLKVVAISGVGGFFGSHLCEELLHRGVKVYGIDINDDTHKEFTLSNYWGITATFDQYQNLHTLIKEKIDVFFHFAWAGGLLQDSFWNYQLQLENAKFACVAFEQAALLGAKRFVNSGTNNQIEIKQFLNSVDFNPRGTTIYAASKMALELMCKTLATKTQTDFVGAMVPMPYGEGNRSMQLFNVVIKKLLEGQSPALIEGNNLYDMVYIDDVVNAFIAMATKGKSGRTYYIGHRSLRTFRSWIEELGKIVNPNVQLKFGEYKDPLNMDYSNVDLDLLYKDTGCECTSDFESTVKKTVSWIKINL